MNEKVIELESRLIKFSVAVTKLAEQLPITKINSNLRNQIVRSCVSAALNYAEAQSAESRADFSHKLRICLKELKETQVNLKIIQMKRVVDNKNEINFLVGESNELVAIFVSSVLSASGN